MKQLKNVFLIEEVSRDRRISDFPEDAIIRLDGTAYGIFGQIRRCGCERPIAIVTLLGEAAYVRALSRASGDLFGKVSEGGDWEDSAITIMMDLDDGMTVSEAAAAVKKTLVSLHRKAGVKIPRSHV